MATAPKAVQKAPAKGAAEGEGKKSGNKIIIILLVLILVGGGGAAAWYFMSQKTPEHAASAHATTAKKSGEPAKPPVFLVIEPFTVNLQPDGVGDQYLQVAFSLQLTGEKDAEVVKLYLPQVRSRLLLLLSGKKASEISTVEGKKKLASEILEQVKQPLSAGAEAQNVTDVLFTSFVIQ